MKKYFEITNTKKIGNALQVLFLCLSNLNYAEISESSTANTTFYVIKKNPALLQKSFYWVNFKGCTVEDTSGCQRRQEYKPSLIGR